MTTKYNIMKKHYDLLISGGYPQNTGMEYIRLVYEDMFGIKIGLYDSYESYLDIQSNPIDKIITLIGPKLKDDKKLPTGIIPFNDNYVMFVDAYTNDILKGNLDPSILRNYINSVFLSMRQIVSNSNLFRKNNNSDFNITLLEIYPLYFTFHHIKESFSNIFDAKYYFNSILLRHYVKTQDDANKVLDSLDFYRYTIDLEKIYNIATCNNTICLDIR